MEHRRVASNATHDWQHLLLQQNFTVIFAANFYSLTKNNSVQLRRPSVTWKTSADSAEAV